MWIKVIFSSFAYYVVRYVVGDFKRSPHSVCCPIFPLLSRSLLPFLCWPFGFFLGLDPDLNGFTMKALQPWASFFFLSVWAAPQPIVDLGYARYQGEALPNGISQWLGMRYAAPPVGSLRFAAPQDPHTVDGVQDASAVATLSFFSCSSFPPPAQLQYGRAILI